MRIIFTFFWGKGSAELSFTTATLNQFLSFRGGGGVWLSHFNTRLGEFMMFRFFLTVRIVNIDRWMEIILLPRAQHPLTRLYWTSELWRPAATSQVQASDWRDEWSSTRLLDLIRSCWPRCGPFESLIYWTQFMYERQAAHKKKKKNQTTFKCHSCDVPPAHHPPKY